MDLARQVSRKWKAGDVYAPHDLSGAEMAKWKKMRRKPRPKVDVLDQLALKPLEHYKVSGIMPRPKRKEHGKCHASCKEREGK